MAFVIKRADPKERATGKEPGKIRFSKDEETGKIYVDIWSHVRDLPMDTYEIRKFELPVEEIANLKSILESI